MPSDRKDDEEGDTKPGFAIYIEGFAPVYVTYCPFCGTRLDCVGIEILSKYRYRKPAPKPAPILVQTISPPQLPSTKFSQCVCGSTVFSCKPKFKMFPCAKIRKPVLAPVRISLS